MLWENFLLQTWNYLVTYDCFYISLAVFVAHLHGAFYKHVIAKQGNFSTQMSVSGPATSTGKSLMMQANMFIFHGEEQPTSTTMTEATFFEVLEDGNIYGKYIEGLFLTLVCFIF